MDNNIKETLLLTVEIQAAPIGGWYLLLENSITEKEFECKSIEEFNEKLIMLQNLYPQHELLVEWMEAGENVLPEHINDIRQQLIAYEEKLENEEQEQNGGFNPNQA